MGLRSRVGWLVHGGERTAATLNALEAEVRDLQSKVAALTQAIVRLDGEAARGSAETLRVEALVTAMKDQLRAVTDDLGDRVGAVVARLDAGR